MKFQQTSSRDLVRSLSTSSLVWVIGSKSDVTRRADLRKLMGDVGDRAGAMVEALPAKIEAGTDHLVPALGREQAAIMVTTLPAHMDMLSLLEAFRSAIKSALHDSHKSLTVVILGTQHLPEIAEAVGVVLGTRTGVMPTYGERTKKEKPMQLTAVQVFSKKKVVQVLERAFYEGQGTHLVRALGMTPGNYLNSEMYGKKIEEIGRESKLKVKFISNTELKKMGAGAFTAVDQANPDSKGGIWELEYRPTKKRNKKPVVLVGKGLCFDTGGYDVKSGNSMVTMKGDMQGSAVALAVLVTAARLKLPLHLKAYLGVTENHISPKGYKADDVVTALNGMTIEVVDTDAEGRMVLADTLHLATKDQPSLCVDFATLTGAARRALGKRYSAAFTNTEKLRPAIVSCGRESGERVWTFPMDDDYAKAIESPVADILQCPKDPGPDHIWAACFLSKFVAKGVPWVHVDLCASECEGGLGPTDTLFTGFGVRWALRFLDRVV